MFKNFLLVMVLITLTALPAMAQRGGGRFSQGMQPGWELGERRLPTAPTAPDRGENTQELLERVLLARMAQEIDLNDEQLVLIVRQLSEFRDNLHLATQERQGLLHELRARVAENASNRGDVLERLLEKDREIETLREQVHQSLAEVLEPEEHARVYLFLEDFDGRMRSLVEQVRGQSEPNYSPPTGRPGPGGPGAGEMIPGGPPWDYAPRHPSPPQRPMGPVRPERPEDFRMPTPPQPPQANAAPTPEEQEERREVLRRLLERRRLEIEGINEEPTPQ